MMEFDFNSKTFNQKLPQLLDFVNTHTDGDYTLSVKKNTTKRSLDANAYFWVLCSKLAVYHRKKKEEIYKDYIKNIGGNETAICCEISKKEQVIKDWMEHGIGWLCDDLGESKIKGCEKLILYAGSSSFDTGTMSRMIDLAVQDCQQVGIETLTPEELLFLKFEWSEKCEKNQ